MRVVKLTESDLTRIVEKIIQEQNLQVTGVEPLKKVEPTGNEKLVDSLYKQRGAEKNAQGKWVFPCLKKLDSIKVPGSTGKFNVLGSIYTFKTTGIYTREANNQKTQGTWKCDSQGFVELDGKQKLGGPKQSFQWKTAPTEEEVRDGKKILRYGMMGEFVGKVQQKLKTSGNNPGAIDNKFGTNTLNAVKNFQKKSGLKDDGLVGKNTYAALFSTPTQKTSEPSAPEIKQVEKTNVKPLEQPRVATQQQNPQVQRQSQIPVVPAKETRKASRATQQQTSTNQIPTDSF